MESYKKNKIWHIIHTSNIEKIEKKIKRLIFKYRQLAHLVEHTVYTRKETQLDYYIKYRLDFGFVCWKVRHEDGDSTYRAAHKIYDKTNYFKKHELVLRSFITDNTHEIINYIFNVEIK